VKQGENAFPPALLPGWHHRCFTDASQQVLGETRTVTTKKK
jgi:hypothetical protein